MKRAQNLELIGGHVALDFANTAGNHASPERSEWLRSYSEVTGWARHAAVLDERGETRLDALARRDPRAAEGALHRIVALREALYRVFSALARGRSPDPDDLGLLHAARRRALDAADLQWDDGPVLRWKNADKDLMRPIHPIAVAALDLLGSGPLDRLKQCGNHPCGWLFLDRSRSGTRRWCSSAECGNQTRVRRHRARKRRGEKGSA